MSRKDMSITVRNLTGKQYSWLEGEKERTGISISAIVKIIIQAMIEEMEPTTLGQPGAACLPENNKHL